MEQIVNIFLKTVFLSGYLSIFTNEMKTGSGFLCLSLLPATEMPLP
jgi:hypothetical protein